MWRRNKRFKNPRSAQVTVSELAILLVVIMIALIFMSVYLRRAMQGRLREAADQISWLYNPKGGTEIDDVSNFWSNEVITEITTTQDVDFGGEIKEKDVTNSVIESIDSSRSTVNETARLVDMP